MPKFRARFSTQAEVWVELEATDDEDAADKAWTAASEYLQTLAPSDIGNARVDIVVDLDGIGADQIDEAPW
jgi:hypothetical protein